MMIKKTYTLFELPTPEDQIYKLLHHSEFFIDTICTMEAEDKISFTYDTSELINSEEILKKPLLERLRFLINASELEVASEKFSFTLALENLYYDMNLKVKVLEKNVTTEHNPSNFGEEYQALIGAVLNPKYSFSDYNDSGKWLYSKSKTVNLIVSEPTVADMVGKLHKLYEKEKEKEARTKIAVNKKRYQSLRIGLPISLILMALSLIVSGYFYFVEIPFKDAILTAENAFLVEDYNSAIGALHNISVEKLPKESKYQLARAFIISESLNQNQKENILRGISMKSTEDVLDYWIYLGRIDYEKAIDAAQRMRDDELQLYALLKYQVSIENDTHITGEEKTEKLEKIGSQITTLERKRTEKMTSTNT